MLWALPKKKKEEEERKEKKDAEGMPEQQEHVGSWERYVRVEVGPSHVRADGPIRKLDFYSNHIVKPLGNLKQESDII